MSKLSRTKRKELLDLFWQASGTLNKVDTAIVDDKYGFAQGLLGEVIASLQVLDRELRDATSEPQTPTEG